MLDHLARRLAVALTVTLLLAGLPAPVAAAPTAGIEPARGPVGTPVTIRGTGWPAGRLVTASLGRVGEPLERWLSDWLRGVVAADGSLLLSGTVPAKYAAAGGASVAVAPGDYSVVVATTSGGGGDAAAIGAMFTVTPAAPPGPPAINWRFADYYYGHDGGRLLGSPIDEIRFEAGRRVQYFEKGRIEDHAGAAGAVGEWRFIYGRLAAELAQAGVDLPVGGAQATLTYAGLRQLAAAERRLAPAAGWTEVSVPIEGGPVFVPVDARLAPAPGHLVPARFWAYINRPELFPAGWLHDIGLPLTEAVPATVTKWTADGPRERRISVQLFERTVLTDDPANPEGWQIERANVGADYLKVARGPVIPGDVVLHPAFTWIDPTTTELNLPEGMVTPVWEWRSHFSTSARMEDEITWLRQALAADGWTVRAGPAGGFAIGGLVATKPGRMQTITWWLGTQPSFPPVQPELGTQMRVLVGGRSEG